MRECLKQHMQLAHVISLGEKVIFMTIGSSKISDRQFALWETGMPKNVRMITIDQRSHVLADTVLDRL